MSKSCSASAVKAIINTGQVRLYDSAISGMKKEGILRRCYRHRPVQYLNNILGQDHRAIKRRVKAKQGFRGFHATRTLGDLAPVGEPARHDLQQLLGRLALGCAGFRRCAAFPG